MFDEIIGEIEAILDKDYTLLRSQMEIQYSDDKLNLENMVYNFLIVACISKILSREIL